MSMSESEHQQQAGGDAGAEEAARQAGEQAEHIAAEGGDVRERVRKLVVDTVEQRRLSFDQLGEVSQSVLEGAASGVKEAEPEQQESALRGVIDGLADAYATAANATRLALEEANQRRQSFAQEDLQRAMRDLRALDERFMRTVTNTTGSAWRMVTEQLGAMKEHTERAAQSIRPSMESALKAATDHPGQLAGEAASAGVKASRQTAGRLLQAMAGLLQGAGDALSQTGKQSEKTNDQTKDTGQ